MFLLKDWIPVQPSQRGPRLPGMTRFGAGRGVFSGWAAEVCSAEATELPILKRPPVSVANGLCHPQALDPGSFHPTKPLRALARPRQAGMTRFYSLRVVYFWVGCLFQKKLSAPRAPIKKLDIIKGFK